MGDVSDDYGQRVGMALKAVRQLHEDASRLLSDCDRVLAKGKRVCTRTYAATGGMSSLLNGSWMAKGAYRCYAAAPDKQPGLVEAVCLCFFGEIVARDEPLLIAGQISYRLDAGQGLADVCDGWDLWYLFANDCPERRYDEVLWSGPLTWQEGGKSFDGFRLLAVPLYSIKSLDDVVALMNRVRAAEVPFQSLPASTELDWPSLAQRWKAGEDGGNLAREVNMTGWKALYDALVQRGLLSVPRM
jgi:hypothetical protein